MLEKVSQIHKTYLLDQQLFCWRHFSKTEVVQNTHLKHFSTLTHAIKFEFSNPETPLWQMDGVELRGFCFAAPSNTVTQKFGLFENMLVKI